MTDRPLHIPVIRTQRLRLEALGMTHTVGMYQLWSDPEVCRYSGIVRDNQGRIIPMPASSQADSDRIIDFWIQAAQDGWGYRWAVILKDTDTFTGTVGFNSITACAELAYHLLPAYWGRGLMNEACDAAIDRQHKSGSRQIEAFVEPANTASIRLAERLGLLPTDEYSEGAQRFQRVLRTQGFSAR